MQDNGELSALVARNIGDIEAAMTHATEIMDVKLHDECFGVLREELEGRGWFVKVEDDFGSSWLAPGEWVTSEEDTDTRFRFSVRDEDAAFSWLMCFVGPVTAEARMGLQFESNFNKTSMKHALRNAEVRSALEAAGLHYDVAQVWMPLSFSAEHLAAAFGEDDFSSALEPLRVAALALDAAGPALDLLRKQLLLG